MDYSNFEHYELCLRINENLSIFNLLNINYMESIYKSEYSTIVFKEKKGCLEEILNYFNFYLSPQIYLKTYKKEIEIRRIEGKICYFYALNICYIIFKPGKKQVSETKGSKSSYQPYKYLIISMEELNYILSILYHTDYIINRKNNDYEFQICYKHGYVIYDSQKERIKLLYKNIMQQYIKQLNNEDYDEIFIKKEEIDFYSKEKINHIYAKIMVNYKNVCAPRQLVVKILMLKNKSRHLLFN